MAISNAARAHGHRYDTTRTNAPCVMCGTRFGGVWLTCRYDNDNDMPRYWVLVAGMYSDTKDDYMAADSQAHAIQIARRAGDGFLGSPGAHVYDGLREPWDESDPYPDYTVTQGPRGGMVWERA